MCLALAQPGSLCIRGMLPSYHIGRLSFQGCVARAVLLVGGDLQNQRLGFLIQVAFSVGLVIALSGRFQWRSSLSLLHHPEGWIRR